MKVQNKKNFGIMNKLFLLAVVFVLEVVLIGQTSIFANAQGTATVKADAGKIRKEANTNSDVLASVKQNDKLTVVAQVTASDGYTWYKVFIDDTTKGYIRADLVKDVEGSIEAESASDASQSTGNETTTDSNTTTDSAATTTTTTTTTDNAQEEEEPAEQAVEFVQVNDSAVSKAKVTASSVNVRSNPSTSASVAGKAKEGTEVNVFGEATDKSGNIWYQVKFTTNDKTVEGFIRHDFLEVLETQNVEEVVEEAPVEEAPVEEPVEETVVPKEYEVVYEANPEGVEEWFLYDHNRGTKQSIADLLAVVRQLQDDEGSAASKLKTYKIIMIVLIAVVLALIVGVTLLVFKLRDAYEYEYEDDEEDDDDDDDDDEDDEEDDEDENDEDDEVYSRAPATRRKAGPVRTAAPAPSPKKAPASSWQSKNFLDVDDDMEFEFLDIK